jgi:hypothetical protein
LKPHIGALFRYKSMTKAPRAVTRATAMAAETVAVLIVTDGRKYVNLLMEIDLSTTDNFFSSCIYFLSHDYTRLLWNPSSGTSHYQFPENFLRSNQASSLPRRSTILRRNHPKHLRKRNLLQNRL